MDDIVPVDDICVLHIAFKGTRSSIESPGKANCGN